MSAEHDDAAAQRNAAATARDDAANARDADAQTRRRQAAARDDVSSARDRRSRVSADDGDAGFPDRFLSGRDVDDATGDRADALADEQCAGQDRQHSRDDRAYADAERALAGEARAATARELTRMREAMAQRTIVAQARGLLMGRHAIGADDAFQLLVGEARARDLKLWQVALTLVEDAEPGPAAPRHPPAAGIESSPR